MKKTIYLITLFICTLFLLTNTTAKGQKCFIKGKVIGNKSKSILLLQAGEDYRYDGIEIPIQKGEFEYELNVNQPLGYTLMFGEARQRGGRYMYLFLEPGEIEITLYPEDEFDKNIVIGGQLNLEYQKLKHKIDSIGSKGKSVSDFTQDYINENPSIVSYFLLYENLSFHKNNVDINKIKNSYNKLSEKFPSHPYNIAVKNIIGSMEIIQVGGKYIDFSAPDIAGKSIKLSEIIEGKVAIIDLWATWCGSCIAKSRKMIPIYEEFKDSGFTVVGVAGELKNTDNLKKFLKKEKFPWLNLVDLDRQNNIWEKYGIPHSGGRVFLVDKNGTIVAIDPTAEEVKEKLKELIK